MKKNLLVITILTFILMLALSTDIDAQHRRKKKKKKKKKENTEYFDESGGFKHRLWYGLGGNLGFRQLQGGSVFNIGISPMVGFKIIESVSVGPRFTLNNQRWKVDYGTDIVTQNITEYGAGLFARYKPFRQFFAHTEYESITTNQLFDNGSGLPAKDPDDPTQFYTEKSSRSKFLVGAGYTSGSDIGYEILILYNLLREENDFTNPLEFRVGFTYKF